MSAHREAVRSARSIVVKIGTTALTNPSGLFDAGRLAVLAAAIEGLDEVRHRCGDRPPVRSPPVSSRPGCPGAHRPGNETSRGQCRSGRTGQCLSAAFARYDRTVGQVLLTAHDISQRVQHTNAQRTLDRLRALHAVAIVNENDTVATNEIRFGDNDRLVGTGRASGGADALVLLDIDGLYDLIRVRAARGSSGRWPVRTTSMG